MTPSQPNPLAFNDRGEFHSRDSSLLIDDQPGDNTVRSPSAARLQWADAERKRLAKYGFNLDGTRIEPPPADGK